MDRGIETMENQALYAFTDLIETCKPLISNLERDVKEIAKDAKFYTDLNGRTDTNLIDSLNAMNNYYVNKSSLRNHMENSELSLSFQRNPTFLIKACSLCQKATGEG